MKMPAMFLALLLLAVFGCDDDPVVPDEDRTAPADVRDLEVISTTESSIELEWTAPGDDGTQGRATLYDIRYATSQPEEVSGWWDSVTTVVRNPPHPRAPGYPESLTLSQLSAGETYYVCLRAADEESNWSGFSNVAEGGTPCALTVTYPNDRVDGFCPGETVEISWTLSDCGGEKVSIGLLHDGESCAIVADSVENSGSYLWPAVPCGSETELYKIRVVDTETGEWAESHGLFAIRSECSVFVGYPDDHTNLCENGHSTIRWDDSQCCGDSVDIDLLRYGSVVAPIGEGVSNTGTYGWSPQRVDEFTSGYQVRVTDTSSGAAGYSGTFNIKAPEPRLTYPNGGERFYEGDPIEIRWQNDECRSGMVRLELLRDNEPCITISESTENDGSYRWETASCDNRRDGYTIRIMHIGSDVSDVSNGQFSITQDCVLDVYEPHRDQYICEGDSITIAWESNRWCGESLAIELLHMSELCRTIATDVLNDGSYRWMAEPCASEPEGYMIRLLDPLSGLESTSEPFTIDPKCSITLRRPTRERFLEGAEMQVQWQLDGCCGDDPAMRVDLLHEGEWCAEIADSTQGPMLLWITERCVPDTTGYSIKVTHRETGAAVESHEFKIIPTEDATALLGRAHDAAARIGGRRRP